MVFLPDTGLESVLVSVIVSWIGIGDKDGEEKSIVLHVAGLVM